MISARADVVGSLLRPPELLEARQRYAEGEISAAEFKGVEDRAVDWAIALQERAGLPVVTDGEMRRESFQSQLVEAVEGFGEHTIDAYLWGEWHGEGAVGDRRIERPPRSGSWASCAASGTYRWRSSSTPGPARTGLSR